MKNLLSSALVGFGALYIASSASAGITFEFNKVVHSDPFTSDRLFATLVIQNAGLDTVSLTLNYVDASPWPRQGLEELYLNVDPYVNGSITSSSSLFDGVDWDRNDEEAHSQAFDIEIEFDEDKFLVGNSVAMTARGRGLTENSFIAFSVDDPDDDHPNFEPYMGLIIVEVDDDDFAEVVLGQPIPEPASLLALGSGFLLLLRRRKPRS